MSRTQITLYGHEKVDVHFFQVFYVCVTAWPSQGLPIINVEIPLDLPEMGKQRCRQVLKSGQASTNVVGIICPLVRIGLTELPDSGWAKPHPAHLLTTSLLHLNEQSLCQKCLDVQAIFINWPKIRFCNARRKLVLA